MDYRVKKILAAIPKSDGIITVIAKRSGCSWHTARRYTRDHPEIAQAYENEIETCLDNAESELHKLITAGDFKAIKFFLSTKGKSRGYVIRQEITGADSGALRIEYVNDWRNTDNQTPEPASGATDDPDAGETI